MWRYDIVNSITGTRVMEVDPPAFTGGSTLNDTASGSVKLTFSNLTLEEARTYVANTLPVRHLLVQSWVDADNPNGYAVSAQYIMPRKRTAGEWGFTAQTNDLWWMLDRRSAIGPASTNPADSRYVVSNSSFSNYVRRLLEIAQNNGEAQEALPVVLPAATSGPRNWDIRGFDSPIIGDLMRTVANEGSGPEIWLQPSWTAAMSFQWLVHVSTSLNQGISTSFNLGADFGNAFDIDLAEDASDMGSRVIAVGEGSGAGMIMGAASGSSGLFPTMERFVMAKDAKTVAQAQRVAAGYRDAGLSLRTDVAFKVRAEALPTLKLGQLLTLKVNDDDPFLSAGDSFTVRLAAYTTDGTETVTLHTY